MERVHADNDQQATQPVEHVAGSDATKRPWVTPVFQRESLSDAMGGAIGPKLDTIYTLS